MVNIKGHKSHRILEQAIQVLENVDLARTHHGPSSRALGDALMSLSVGIFFVFRDYKELIALRREAFKIAVATEPSGSLRRAGIAEMLAITLLGVWRPDEVWPMLEEILRGNENLPD